MLVIEALQVQSSELWLKSSLLLQRIVCISILKKDLWTWSDKHSPVCENIKGSVRTVPEDKKSILKLVPSTRRGAGMIIMRRSSMVVTSMTSDKLHHFLPFDRNQSRASIGGHLCYSPERQTLLADWRKVRFILLRNSDIIMDCRTGVRKWDIIRLNYE